MKKRRNEYSIVSPVYNGSKTIGPLCKRLIKVMDKITQNFEIVLVDDGSTDNSWKIMKKLRKQDQRIKIIRLSRNFGQHNATLCGMVESNGDFVITIDDDLQQPPEEIPKLIKKMNEGFSVVIGTFEKKKHSLYRNLGSWVFNKINKSVFRIPEDIILSSFIIYKRDIVKTFSLIKSSFVYIPGFIFKVVPTGQVGFTTVKHEDRTTGKSNYSLIKLIKYSSNLFINYSSIPLFLVAIYGIIVSFFSICLSFYIIINKIINPDYGVMGWNSLMVVISFLGGSILLAIAVLGEYLRRILNEVSYANQYFIGEKEL